MIEFLKCDPLSLDPEAMNIVKWTPLRGVVSGGVGGAPRGAEVPRGGRGEPRGVG